MGRPVPGWDVQILDEDEQPVRGASAARSACAPAQPYPPVLARGGPREDFGGEWFHTKDAARMDEDGYVWYEGRADDVIISAGYRIGPFEVESACLEHPQSQRRPPSRRPTKCAATSSRRSSAWRRGTSR